MVRSIERISNKDFEQNVSIRFDNINDGFDLYKSYMLQGFENLDCEQNFIDFVLDAYKLNGRENTYVDFYYNRLSDEDKRAFYSLLDESDKRLIASIKDEIEGSSIYYKPDKRFLEMTVRLSIREILFSTIYFTKYPCTIWGNYNMKFPLFYDNDEDVRLYKEIADERCLELI